MLSTGARGKAACFGHRAIAPKKATTIAIAVPLLSRNHTFMSRQCANTPASPIDAPSTACSRISWRSDVASGYAVEASATASEPRRMQGATPRRSIALPAHAVESSHESISTVGRRSCSSPTSTPTDSAIELKSVGGAAMAAPTTQKKERQEAARTSAWPASSPRALSSRLCSFLPAECRRRVVILGGGVFFSVTTTSFVARYILVMVG